MDEFLVYLKKDLERSVGRECSLDEFLWYLRSSPNYATFDLMPTEAKEAVWGDDYYAAANRRRKHGNQT